MSCTEISASLFLNSPAPMADSSAKSRYSKVYPIAPHMAKDIPRMNQPLFGDSTVSKAVKELLYRIHDVNPLSQSIYQQAAVFFSGVEQQAIDTLQQQLTELQQRLNEVNKSARPKIEKRMLDCQNELKDLLRLQEENRLGRIRQLKQTAKHIVEAVTGETPYESNQPHISPINKPIPRQPREP